MALSESEELELLQLQKAKSMAQTPQSEGSPHPILNGIASAGNAVMEGLYSPFQVAGEAIRGAGEGEPLQVATAQNPQGFRAPSILQRMMPSLRTPQPPADPFQKAYQGLEGIANLPGGIQQAAAAVTAPPSMAAQIGGLGMSLGMGDALSPTDGLSMVKKKLFAPKVPASRAFDVATAEKYGLGPTMTRADLTGGAGAAKIESALGSTLTGGAPINANNEEKMRLIEQARANIADKFGTAQSPSAVGQDARLGMQGEMGEASQTARNLYKQIPDVPIPPSNLEKALNDVDFKNVDKGAAKTISEIRARLGHEAPITESGSASSVGPVTPEQPATPTFQKLNDIRNLLSKEIQADTKYNPIIGNQIGEKAQALIPIKKALDADYGAYVKASRSTPYGNMESSEFDRTFTRANSFYGDLQQLKSNKLVRKLADPSLSPSDIPNVIFRSGNIEDINTAKAVLGQDGYKAAKQSFFTDLLNSKNIDRELGKYSDEFLKGAFTGDELQALKEAGSLAKTAKTAETMAGNTSRTAGHLATLATGGGLMDAARRLFSNPIAAAGEAAATLGGPYLGAKAYLGTSRGVNVPAIQGSMAKLLATVGSTGGQGLNVIGKDPKAMAALTALAARLKKGKKESE